jgi:hypothetical protein
MSNKQKKNEQAWEKDQPWLIPSNEHLGINYVMPGRRFAEQFLSQKQFKSAEFKEWVDAQEEFRGRTDYSKIKRGIEMAGFRQDMPVAYDINRIAKDAWAVLSPLEAIQKTEVLPSVKAALRRDMGRMLKRMRVTDLDTLDRDAYANLKGLFMMARDIGKQFQYDEARLLAHQEKTILSIENSNAGLLHNSHDKPLLED